MVWTIVAFDASECGTSDLQIEVSMIVKGDKARWA